MLYRLQRGLTEIVRGFIVVHKAQIHQTLLQLFYDLMTDALSQVFRCRFRILRQLYVLQIRQDLTSQSQGCDVLCLPLWL